MNVDILVHVCIHVHVHVLYYTCDTCTRDTCSLTGQLFDNNYLKLFLLLSFALAQTSLIKPHPTCTCLRTSTCSETCTSTCIKTCTR